MTKLRIELQKRPLVLLFILSMILLSPSLLAQDYQFRHITPSDGLAGGLIYKIVQDEHGFVWIATANGLSKFDGHAFKNYRSDSNIFNSLSDNEISDLLVLPNDQLLIAHTGGMELLYMATDHFKKLTFKGNETIRGIQRIRFDENGDLWAVDFASNLVQFSNPDFQSDSLTQITVYDAGLQEDNNFVDIEWYRDELWIGLDKGFMVFNPVSKEFREISSPDSSIRKILDSSNWDLQIGPDANLYASFYDGLLRYNYSKKELEKVENLGSIEPSMFDDSDFLGMMVDSKNNLWIGTTDVGAVRWNLFTNEATLFQLDPQNDQSLNSNDVHNIFEDQQQNIWFGYHRLGTTVMYPQPWEYEFVIPIPELPLDDIKNKLRHFKLDDEGTLWATTDSALIQNVDSPEQRYFEFPENYIQDVGPIIIDFTEEHLIILLGNKILTFSKESNSFADIKFDEETTFVPLNIVESDQYLYLPTTDLNKILVLDNKELSTEVLDIGSSIDDQDRLFTIPVAVIGNDLYVHILTFNFTGQIRENSLHMFKFNLQSGALTKLQAGESISIQGISIPTFSSLNPGVSYYPVNDGLIRINNLTQEADLLLEGKSSLFRERNLRLTEDHSGQLWTVTSSGLLRFSPESETLYSYDLPESRLSSLGGISVLDNGDLISSGNNQGGYLRFNPDELNFNQAIERIHITSLTNNDDEFNILYDPSAIEIPSSDNNLAIKYVGLNYTEPEATKYRYRILGSKKEDWIEVGSQRSVYLSNLSSGTYTFEVQSIDQLGSYNTQSASVTFTILPPWWNTWIAYLAYALIFGVLVFGLDRFQRKRLLQKERERVRDNELQHAKEIEKAYENLKVAQDQLIQQEKLASLGQLTAGIAHEIKNPLNFVNNFSDLSIELIEEAQEELSRAYRDTPNAPEFKEISSLHADIASNLKKIHGHGTRADSIVKSMLEHSRGGAGLKEPTNINLLVKEYVNLSFHGLRAGKTPINVIIQYEFKEDLPLIPLVSEDFSRIIINLCNNAFEAMRLKLNQAEIVKDQQYSPELIVRTGINNNKVFVEIEDNGIGIPDEIKDKIMQPFFTTKKGTEGTGLGLSITNDIIKAHGGDLEIQSTEGKGSTFIIAI